MTALDDLRVAREELLKVLQLADRLNDPDGRFLAALERLIDAKMAARSGSGYHRQALRGIGYDHGE